jgi:two-component system, chemotaxis family, response regulator Rcp1
MLNNIIPIKVLLVEDNPGDVRLIQETFKENRILTELNVMSDGEEAINYLKKIGKYKNESNPDLILLDLNLPKLDGREILAEIKDEDNLRRIPVIVLTSSSAESDVYKSYDLNANCFISKPVDLDSFINVLKSIENFWFTIVKLPR